MPRDDKKITLDDILAEYERRDDVTDRTGKKSGMVLRSAEIPENMEISEEITIDGSEELDGVKVAKEPFVEPEPEHTWQAFGIEKLPIVSDTYDSKPGQDEKDSKPEQDAEDSKPGQDAEDSKPEQDAEDSKSAKGASESKPVQDDAAGRTDSVIRAMETSDDVNDRFLARTAKAIFPVKGDSIGEVIRKMIFLIAVIVFIGAGIMLVSTLVQSKEAVDIQESVRDIIVTTVATTIDENGIVQTIPPTPEEIIQHNIEVAKSFSDNEDYVGYLEVPGCVIYEPVVQGDDNDKYLRTNIYGDYNKAGTLFVDYRCSLTDEYTSPNIVIYGHNQEDGTMFGRLKLYKYDLSFYQRNPYVRFSTGTKTNQYLVYGFFITNASEDRGSDDSVFHYHDYIDEINDENVFDWYLGEVQARNQIISPVDVRYGDELLCLSTCSSDFSDSRFVVFARKLRAGESVYDYDFSKARLNPYAKGVDWDAVLSGDDLDDIYDDVLSEVVTSEKSIGKRNVRTETASEETEALPEEPAETTVVTTVPAETEESSSGTVLPSESSDTEAETAGRETAGENTDSDSGSDGSGEGSDSSAGDSSETTSAKKKTNKSNSTQTASE